MGQTDRVSGALSLAGQSPTPIFFPSSLPLYLQDCQYPKPILREAKTKHPKAPDIYITRAGHFTWQWASRQK